MNRGHRVVRALLLSPMALGAGGSLACGSSPEPTYFALSANPGAKAATPPHVIKLRRIGLAGYLDRADIVDRVMDYKLHVASGNRWGEPLGEMLGRVLAEDLSSRMPTSTVFSESGALSVDADTALEVDVQRFDAGPDGLVNLVVQVAVERGRAATGSRAIQLSARPRDESTSALVAAMSDLLAELADAVVALLRSA